MKAGIVGASGYLGAELLRLLAGHPLIEVQVLQSHSSAGSELGSVHPGLSKLYGDKLLEPVDSGALRDCEVVFVAVPSGASQPIVAALLETDAVIVDLGADFRLKDPSAYERWYGFSHTAPQLLDHAVYGLPEFFRDELAFARLIAAPGCYVTAAGLGLRPLVLGGIIEPAGIIIDAASGTSGAGRGLEFTTHHATANESFSAYKVATHRHTPEIEQLIEASVLFTPHLAPMTRGILATCYGRLAGDLSTEDLLGHLEEAYAGERFIEVSEELPGTRDTYGSNLARLSARVDDRTGTAIVIVAIDNLTKGGAGQAIQAANVALRLDESRGLSCVGMTP